MIPTGEKRDFVAAVARLLANRFREEQILYDKFHEAEFARSDLANPGRAGHRMALAAERALARHLGQLGRVRAVDQQVGLDAQPLRARLGDALHQLLVHVEVERVRHLAVRGRERFLGEGVGRRLVVADVQRSVAVDGNIGESVNAARRCRADQFIGCHAGQGESAARDDTRGDGTAIDDVKIEGETRRRCISIGGGDRNPVHSVTGRSCPGNGAGSGIDGQSRRKPGCAERQ